MERVMMMLVNIAIVEDDDIAAKSLLTNLKTYEKENEVTFATTRYADAVAFLSDSKTTYDIVFMDIELPMMNGMDAAFKLREKDKKIIIIFVTNMAQYAVRGYEVDALYYILKPLNYQSVAHKLKKALSLIRSSTEMVINLPQASGLVRISTKDLTYVEITGHKLFYHTATAIYKTSGSLSVVEKTLEGQGFFRCNSCYLVNAKHIAFISGYDVLLFGGETLRISHPRKKQFMLELARWLGDGNT